MYQNNTLYERTAVVGVVDPDAYAAGTYVTAWVLASRFKRLMAIIMVGDMQANSTINAKLRRASDSSGTGAEDISGAAITQLTQAGADDNKQVILNYDVDHEKGNAKEYIALSCTIATAASDFGAVLLGGDARNDPASDYDLTSVDEVVNA